MWVIITAAPDGDKPGKAKKITTEDTEKRRERKRGFFPQSISVFLF
jgi:hypothetical protein